MPDINYFVGRTDQKLRFARIHLDELRNYGNRNSGDDFERCHQESFLFHFLGASDAFLQELNIYYQCGLKQNKVRIETIQKSLKTRCISCPEFRVLERLEAQTDSYLGIAKELRHHSTHRGGIPIQHYFNGPSYLVHPKTRKELNEDTAEMFEKWLNSLAHLLSRLRVTAKNKCV